MGRFIAQRDMTNQPMILGSGGGANLRGGKGKLPPLKGEEKTPKIQRKKGALWGVIKPPGHPKKKKAPKNKRGANTGGHF